jgi:hypothetical protein
MTLPEDGDEAVGVVCFGDRLQPGAAMSRLFLQIAPLTCLSFSFIDIDARTCMKDMPDSSLVRSASLSFFEKQPWATSILSSL